MFPVIDTGILLVLNQGVGPVRSFRGPLQEAIWLESGCHGLTGDLGIVARLGFGVRGFGPSAAMPILRISRRTRLRLTDRPSACSSSVIRREPRNGHAVNSSSIRRISPASLSLAAGRLR